MNYNIQLKII